MVDVAKAKRLLLGYKCDTCVWNHKPDQFTTLQCTMADDPYAELDGKDCGRYVQGPMVEWN